MEGLYIIVPCYNEEACIGGVLDEIQGAVPEAVVVAVDDCSTDRTLEVLRSRSGERLAVLALPANLGIGGAVQAGFLYAVRHGARYAVKFDGDGQHPADRIRELAAPLETGEADLTIGSRYLDDNDGFKSTALRRVGIRFFSLLNRMLIGRRITDNTSGFRGYNREALEFAARHYPSFDYPEPEEVVIMHRNGFRLAEVSTPMRERQAGSSSINIHRSAYYMLKVTFAILMSACRVRKREVRP